MKTFVVTVIANMILEVCEIFDDVDQAISFANLLANDRFSQLYIKEQWSDDMRGWIIGETDKYFVSVVERETNIISRPGFYGCSAYSSSFSYMQTINQISPVTAPLVKPPIAAPSIVAQANDYPKEPTLPGGFSPIADNALFMEDITTYNAKFKKTYEMSDKQLTALLKARLSKRPNFMALIPGVGLYSQKYAIEELKNKTVVGEIIRQLLLSELVFIYDEVDRTNSPSDTDTDLDSEKPGYFSNTDDSSWDN